jgi:RsiW-degrading membrane proteinase PrsW (M82 family)
MSLPVPRAEDEASFSELVPFRSTKIDLKKSPLLLFALVTAVAVPFMFGLMMAGDSSQDLQAKVGLFQMSANVAVFYILLAVLIGFFTYSRTDRPIWVFGLAFLAVAIITATPLFVILAFPFRGIIPGIVPMGLSQQFLPAFIGMFVIAGLTEEFIKALPILFGAWLSHRVASGQVRDRGLAGKFRVRGPLDGVVMGLFAGAGFIMAETAFEYVPRQFSQVFQGSGSFDAGVASALSLLMPRVFGGITGHMGYSAVVGYFIGLSVIRPKFRWKLIGIGYLSASLIHGLWNSVPKLSPLLWYVVAIMTAIFAVACLLKARQIDMSSRGAAPETFGSIIVDRPAAAEPAFSAPPPVYAPPAAPAYVPPTPPAPAAAVEQPIALEVEGLTIPLRAGGTMDLGLEPALGGRGSGTVATIVPHPTRANVLGLRNVGQSAWTARLRDGSQQIIERDQNIRLAPGVHIDFGSGIAGRVVPLG